MPLDGSLLQLPSHDSSLGAYPKAIPASHLKPNFSNNIAQPAPERNYDIPLIEKVLEDANRLIFSFHSDALIEETMYISSLTAITRHPRFNELLLIGQPIIKFILEKMAAGEVHIQWFPLLKRTSGQDPVPYDKRGKISEMASHWVAWGRQHGYIEGNAC